MLRTKVLAVEMCMPSFGDVLGLSAGNRHISTMDGRNRMQRDVLIHGLRELARFNLIPPQESLVDSCDTFQAEIAGSSMM